MTYRPIDIQVQLTLAEAQELRKTQPAGSLLDEVLGDAILSCQGFGQYPPAQRYLLVGLRGTTSSIYLRANPDKVPYPTEGSEGSD